MVLIIIGILLFIALIVAHEYGHFIVAKRNGVEAEEFGIGFPPKIWGKTLGKGIFRTYYSVNLLPIGGFVRLKGENDASEEKGSFGAASFPAKIRIALAGVVVNLVAALLFFTVSAWVGMPQFLDNQFYIPADSTLVKQEVYIGYVDDSSPAATAGLSVADKVVSINGITPVTDSQLRELLAQNGGTNVEIVYQRDGTNVTANAALLPKEEAEKDGKDYLGIVSQEYSVRRATWSAPLVAVGVTGQIIGLTLVELGKMVLHFASAIGNVLIGNGGQAKDNAKAATQGLTGPVGIFMIIKQAELFGIQFLLFFVGALSLALAIMNALPIPALDGGRVFVMSLFRWLKKPLTPELENRIHGAGFAALMLFLIAITWLDINRFF